MLYFLQDKSRGLDQLNIPPVHQSSNVAATQRRLTRTVTSHLSVTLEVEGVVALPGLPPSGCGLVVGVTLAEAARLLAGGGEAAGLTVLVDGVDDPVDARVAANSLVLRVDENDLEVLVGGVLVDPVRIEHTQVGAAAAHTLLGGRLQRSLVLELVHTLVGGLACEESEMIFPAIHTMAVYVP
jgi:hypothetical protein